MLAIVQFIHPGKEHGPDNPPANNSIGWNLGNHKRKFIHSEGEYVKGNTLVKGELMFWGEWEPPNSVISLNQPNGGTQYPEWMHKRILPVQKPPQAGSLQNTDPYVFDGPFRYFVCKQARAHPTHSTKMISTDLTRLDTGSLILFGSCSKVDGMDQFLIDTVFVVGSHYDYDPHHNNSGLFAQLGFQQYYDISYLRAFPLQTYYSLNYRLYIGAAYTTRVSGMYSYTPCKIVNRNQGFPRVIIPGNAYVTSNLRQGFRITEANSVEISNFWHQILQTVINPPNNCLPGVEFK